MREFKRMLIAGGLMAALTQVAICQGQIVRNGSFELGLKDWTSSEGIGVLNTNVWPNAYAADGTNSINLGGGNTSGAVLSQTIPVSAESDYKLNFAFAGPGDTGLTAAVRVDVTTPGGEKLASKTFMQPANHHDLVFIPCSLDFSTPAGCKAVKLTFLDACKNGGIAVDVVIDNVEVQEKVGLVVYESKANLHYVGDGADRTAKTYSRVIFDSSSGRLAAISFAGRKEGEKMYQVTRLEGFKAFGFTDAGGKSHTVLTGKPARGAAARNLKGRNCQLRISQNRVIDFPDKFSGQFSEILRADARKPVLVEGSLKMSYASKQTVANNNVRASLDEAVQSFCATLETLGYKRVQANSAEGLLSPW